MLEKIGTRPPVKNTMEALVATGLVPGSITSRIELFWRVMLEGLPYWSFANTRYLFVLIDTEFIVESTRNVVIWLGFDSKGIIDNKSLILPWNNHKKRIRFQIMTNK